MAYKKTLNLPKTSFSMKANLSQREPQMQSQWDKMDLYGLIRQARKGCPNYTLHDGPPYPTGDLHLGTGLNKVLKDFVVKYKTMRGYDAPYVPGWDCHGLPIEHRVMQELGEKAQDMAKSRIRARCRKYAMKFVEVQKKQFRAFGLTGDWDNPYLTLQPSYEAGILEVFARMVGAGFVYPGLKPIHWCSSCVTALAEAELEYSDVVGPSIYVNFPMRDDVSKLFDVAAGDDVYVMIWTTTPWTLPANMAVAVQPFFDYSAVRYTHPRTGEKVVSIVAAEMIQTVMEAIEVSEYDVLGKVRGKELEGLTYQHPFIDRLCPIVLADYVTLADGTGCVHTAPGHGNEDYFTGLKYELEILNPVDDHGYFTERAGRYEGMHIVEGDKKIVEDLRRSGNLLKFTRFSHSYPHCWRCRNPVIFRATKQWFVKIDHEGFREKVLGAIGGTTWVPPWGHDRIAGMVEERPDWCISRQRSWGVPIPALYCTKDDTVVMTEETVNYIAGLFAEKGADAWFTEDAALFVKPGTTCPECGGTEFRQETDIFDVWFESGSSHNSVVRKHPQLAFPADLYLEGTDQYRGWFQLSLLPSMAAWGTPPFKTVLTHGFVVDEDGKKMSKSLGNFVSAEEGIERFTADILRLWCSSVDYRTEISVNEKYIEKNMADAYRRVRNTFRFLLGNLADFDPRKHTVAHEKLWELDRWALDATARLVENTTRAFDNYDLHRVYGNVHNFCALEMSAFYLDVIKDRLYCSAGDWPERRAAQTVMAHILDTLVRLVAPIIVHTAEEVWQKMPFRFEDVESVHLAHWPQVVESHKDDELHAKWERLLNLRGELQRALEPLRAEKRIGQSLDASVTLYVTDSDTLVFLRDNHDLLAEICMVSRLDIEEKLEEDVDKDALLAVEREIGVWVDAAPSQLPKCNRCWNLRESVGADPEYDDVCDRCAKAVREVAAEQE